MSPFRSTTIVLQTHRVDRNSSARCFISAMTATSKALCYIVKDSRLKADGSKCRRARDRRTMPVVWLKLVTGCVYVRGIDMSRGEVQNSWLSHRRSREAFANVGTALFVKIPSTARPSFDLYFHSDFHFLLFSVRRTRSFSSHVTKRIKELLSRPETRILISTC